MRWRSALRALCLTLAACTLGGAQDNQAQDLVQGARAHAPSIVNPGDLSSSSSAGSSIRGCGRDGWVPRFERLPCPEASHGGSLSGEMLMLLSPITRDETPRVHTVTVGRYGGYGGMGYRAAGYVEDDFSGSGAAPPVKMTAGPVVHEFQLLRSALLGGRKYPYPLVVRVPPPPPRLRPSTRIYASPCPNPNPK